VSLWAQEDRATPISHDFAVRLHERRKAVEFIHGASPSHITVKEKVAYYSDAAIVIVSHGGDALRSEENGDPWASAGDLASMLSGRRVYAFACSTFQPHKLLLLSNFAQQAVDACIQVFIGHRAPVMTPYATLAEPQQRMDHVICQMIEAFIDGENEESNLQDIGRSQVDWTEPVIELDLPSENPEMEGALGWSSVFFLGAYFQNICVARKCL
jgi:hypothetical protein